MGVNARYLYHTHLYPGKAGPLRGEPLVPLPMLEAGLLGAGDLLLCCRVLLFALLCSGLMPSTTADLTSDATDEQVVGCSYAARALVSSPYGARLEWFVELEAVEAGIREAIIIY